MKSSEQIWAAWENGEFVGINKAHARVTVEPNWFIDTYGYITPDGTNWPRADRPGPWRFYQSVEGPMTTEVEVPNVKSISIDRSIDTDAASCTITIYNQWMDNNGVTPVLAGQLGNPGYFTWNRGESPDAQARWAHETNAWNNVLTPMALIRTYEGWGGYTEVDGQTVPMDIEDAVDDGYLTRTGTWIVDKVSVANNGMLTLSCRDAGKLLIEQFLHPPLIPSAMAPLKYYRYKDETYTSIWDPGPGLGSTGANNVPLVYANSSSDVLLGEVNASVYGSTPSNSIDGNATTAAIGFGYDTPDGPEVVDWWEYSVNANLNQVYINPMGGGYTCYISVQENGIWQGDSTVPFTPVPFTYPPIGSSDDEIGADIAYVVSTGLSYNTPITITLPRTYNAQRLRISLRDHKETLLPDRIYRSGLYEVRAVMNSTTVSTTPNSAYAMARHFNNGYWVIDAAGQQFYFGEARELTKNDTVGISSTIISAEGHPTQAGFWTLETNGRVHAYGASQFYGDASSVGANDFIDIAVTHTGNGYWLLRRTGGVYTYGDAQYLSGTYDGNTYLGELPTALVPEFSATAIAGHPTGMGYWITDSHGLIGNFGVATNVGQVSAPFPSWGMPTGIVPTPTGNGYWILWPNGQVFNYGDATNQGQPVGGSFTGTESNPHVDIITTSVPLVGSDHGYWTLRLDGLVAAFGATFFGRPGSNEATIRSDGNYLDYADIVKDLVGWSGFTLVLDTFEGRFVDGVNGIIESTGVFSEEPLSEDIFDKKPVMDAVRTIAEIVGYITYVDEDGGFHFKSPNWWAPGNFYPDGSRVSFLPEVDESRHLFDYSVTFEDAALRSEITIANQMPTDENTTTISTRYIPPGQNILRGMIKPAIWSNEVFNKISEQQIMAELIGMHIWFSQRQSSTTCVANPCIQINDQVRIWERTTGESYIHYVRGINTTHDLDTGEYIMTLTTHWLGSESSWVIRAPGQATPSVNQNEYVVMSPEVYNFLANTGSEITNPAYFLGGL